MIEKQFFQKVVGPGHVPPLRYSQAFSEDHELWQVESLYTRPFNPEAISRTKGAGKPNLLGQVIPVYGFGIFLYIIYIFFKLTHKDRSPRHECRFQFTLPENTIQEIPDYEMAQLQARLRQMEGVREGRASKAIYPPARSQRARRQQEERKLRQLKTITRVMLEGRPLDGVSPEVEAEETPYSADWEGYSEETFPKYEVTFRGRRYPSVILEEPDMDIPTAEELAEGMGREEEEEGEEDDEDEDDIDDENKEEEEFKNGRDGHKADAADSNLTDLNENGENKQDEESEECEEEEEEEVDEETEGAHEGELVVEEDEDECDFHQKALEEEEEDEDDEEVGEDQPCLPQNTDDEEQRRQSKRVKKQREKRQITFSDHRHVFHYPVGGRDGCKSEDVNSNSNEEDSGEEEEDDDADDDEEENHDDVEEEDKPDEGDHKVREEEDPLMEAERLGFHAEVECDPEEQEVDLLSFLLTYQPEAAISSRQSVLPKAPVSGTLRMRHKKPKKKN
ncbi:protein RIC-3 isoform X2 [Hoplias malabaricus]|uniref:protein RIC-3 isoform X2 n=1 Tax=Hoplias malabaricus TaxID=27720 RepID=UPI003461F724